MDEKKALALGYMQMLKPDIDMLKERRDRILVRLRDSLASIASNDAGFVTDFDVGQFTATVQKLGEAQRDLMVKIVEHNQHATRADVTPMLTRSISIG